MSYSEINTAEYRKELEAIIKLRLAIGLLGESDQAGWWSSRWFMPNVSAFLQPIYGDRVDAARYHGLVETARRVHDSHIGVGKAFHLYRLPEALERHLHDVEVKKIMTSTPSSIATKEGAEAFLQEIADSVDARIGPIRVGSVQDLESQFWINLVAGHYLAAFRESHQSFPYFSEAL